jgi:hypothetical protein
MILIGKRKRLTGGWRGWLGRRRGWRNKLREMCRKMEVERRMIRKMPELRRK